ncbi:hypothetical protein OIE66_40610 [Nonomuraea sp. NBC_01738]|uniref:hypothetical protein n=1 Tax=Nonomuraea sp. NBC_01738 TaxID=2976003 RepID=UPI002E11A065|nr:hypothetical protein OIE66_40610 [Nonomuraea sp. NBC_01738]
MIAILRRLTVAVAVRRCEACADTLAEAGRVEAELATAEQRADELSRQLAATRAELRLERDTNRTLSDQVDRLTQANLAADRRHT